LRYWGINISDRWLSAYVVECDSGCVDSASLPQSNMSGSIYNIAKAQYPRTHSRASLRIHGSMYPRIHSTTDPRIHSITRHSPLFPNNLFNHLRIMLIFKFMDFVSECLRSVVY